MTFFSLCFYVTLKKRRKHKEESTKEKNPCTLAVGFKEEDMNLVDVKSDVSSDCVGENGDLNETEEVFIKFQEERKNRFNTFMQEEDDLFRAYLERVHNQRDARGLVGQFLKRMQERYDIFNEREQREIRDLNICAYDIDDAFHYLWERKKGNVISS